MRRLGAIGVLLVLTATFLVVACAKHPGTSAVTTEPVRIGPDPGSRAPTVTLVDADGKQVKLDDLRGDVVLLNFWATWCGPCVEEMPSLQELHESFGEQGLRIVAVSVDQSPELGFAFAEENGLTLDVFFDPGAHAAMTYQVRTIPISFLIDRSGTIVSRLRGSRDWTSSESKERIREALKQES